MELILLFGFVALAAYYIGYHVRGIQLLKLMADNPEHFMIILERISKINKEMGDGDLPEEAVPVQYEVVNSNYYAYDKLSGEFLGQGPTLVDALEQAADRFPGKKFWCERPQQDAQSSWLRSNTIVQ